MLLRLCARSAETDALSAAPALLEALPALLTKYGGDDDLLQTVCALGESGPSVHERRALRQACQAL